MDNVRAMGSSRGEGFGGNKERSKVAGRLSPDQPPSCRTTSWYLQNGITVYVRYSRALVNGMIYQPYFSCKKAPARLGALGHDPRPRTWLSLAIVYQFIPSTDNIPIFTKISVVEIFCLDVHLERQTR